MRKTTAVAERAAKPKKEVAQARDRKVVAKEISSDGTASGKMVGAVVAAIKILHYLGDVQQAVGVSHIAKEAKLNTSTTFNILRTLAMHDFVQFDPVAKTYMLSLGIMEIAKGATAIGGDVGIVRPMIERIANDHGVTVTLWQPVGNRRKVLIMTAHTRNAMRIQMTVGQRLPLLVGAAGRVFAAFGTATEEDLREQFDAIRWERSLTFKEFMEQVSDAREKGWALDDGYFNAGTVLVSTPILDQNGHAIMAVTANMFTGQYDPNRAEAIIRDLKIFSGYLGRLASL
ncbi:MULTISPECIES: IclR family transcriptional regulator [Mesorhizobium]|uniref:IclR family transcriptional regulator n=1 Tax=Mesorhizobium TaxID=68287 RepID=UPI001459FC3D|nr:MULTISPECIES: IclR family transcriptional regulator C-terminal domain-containing protein [Mesorhizobium]